MVPLLSSLLIYFHVTSQQPEPVVKEAPQEVLARANAKGILDKISCNQPSRKQHRRHTNKMTKTSHAPTYQPNLSANNQSKNKDTKVSNSTTLCGLQEFANRRQSFPGGHVYFSPPDEMRVFTVTSWPHKRGISISHLTFGN